MPRYGIKKSNAACIEITDFQSTYLPGDIVLGHVVTAKAFAPGPNADQTWVKLQLFGRAKTKIVDKSGQFTVIYRGRAVMFQEEQCVFRGAVSEGARIPFVVTIPESSTPGFEQRGDSWDKDRDDKTEHMPDDRVFRPKQTFLSNTQEDVARHALPSVYYFRDTSAWSGTTFEAFVEYVLEATLICPGAKNVTTTFPLFIRAKPTEKPLEGNEYQFYVKDDSRAIYSDRLLPENSERRMTFKEKSRRFFSPSKTPRYTFTVKVVYPQAIQLEHPSPLPFKIYIKPMWEANKTTICPDGDVRRLPPVHFVSMELKLISTTRLRCEGSIPGYPHSEDRETTYDVPFKYPFESFTFKVPIVTRGNLKPNGSTQGGAVDVLSEEHTMVPATGSPYIEPGALRPVHDSTTVPDGLVEYTRFYADEEGEYFLGAPFDLGARLDIRLSQRGSSTQGNFEFPFEKPLWPSFATYNIVQGYQLAWKINLSCAGESHTVSGRKDIMIFSPSEEEEIRKKRELGQEGMQKNYDDLAQGLGVVSGAFELGLDVLQAISN
ncbi:hypothetical protein SCUP234_04744 [Seiridium cupressi]